MFTTILHFDFKQLLRSKITILFLLVFSVLGLFSYNQGENLYLQNTDIIDSLIHKQSQQYLKTQNLYDTISYPTQGKLEEETPYMISYLYQVVCDKKISPLSILTIGQNDVHEIVKSGRFGINIFTNSFTEFKNPEQLQVGNIDLTFFVIYLFPLLFIALAYNAKSDDKEMGRYNLLVSQAGNINSLYFYRLTSKLFISVIPLVIVLFYSLFKMSDLNSFSLFAFLKWWAVAFLYIVFWFLLISLILNLNYSSLNNAIMMISVWVLLLVAIPGLLNTYLSYKHPNNSKSDIVNLRDVEKSFNNLSFGEHKKNVYAIDSTFIKDSVRHRIDPLLKAGIEQYSSELLSFKHENNIYNKILQSTESKLVDEKNSYWINPVGCIYSVFTSISNTSIKDQQYFERSVMNYRFSQMNYLFKNLLTSSHFTKHDFINMPSYNVKDIVHVKKSLFVPFIFWMFFILSIISFKIINKHD
jgi:ABC-2 type transport system permease protein